MVLTEYEEQQRQNELMTECFKDAINIASNFTISGHGDYLITTIAMKLYDERKPKRTKEEY